MSQPAWGQPQQPYAPYGTPPPERSVTGLLVLTIVVALALIGGGVALWLTMWRGEPGPRPAGARGGMVHALQDRDEQGTRSYLCAANFEPVRGSLDGLGKGIKDFRIEASNLIEVSNTGAKAIISADVTVSGTLDGKRVSQTKMI